MNKGREGKGTAPSTDLLVCFPSRTHLRLMPKAICSPVRPLEPNKRYSHHQRKRSISRAGGGGQTSSPMLWTKNKSTGSENSEPTSPKVTCAGQIKVRHKNTASRSWQSVMEEIEKIHNNKKQKKRLNWAESLGFKKEIMHFFTCLRAVRFDLRCFGSFSGTDIVTEDEEEEDDGEDEDKDEVYYENDHIGVDKSHDDDNESSRAVFSKWFMVLQEEQNGVHKEEEKKVEIGDEHGEISVPPPNALLLMRCRSAPAKSWLTESEEEEEEEEGGNNNEKVNISHKKKEKEIAQTHVKKGQSLKSLMEEEKINKKENLVVMRYNPEFYGISTDIAAETWIVGGLPDPMSRSRSWKR